MVHTYDEIRNAENVLRDEYWDDIRSIITDVMDEIKTGNITDREAAIDYIHECIDGHQRCIYMGKAIDTLRWCSNENAAAEQGMQLTESGGQISWGVLAYFAIQEDVMEEIRRMGTDLDDPELYYQEENEDGVE